MNPRTRDIRLRRAAQRQGLALYKSRRRDPRAIGYDRWAIVPAGTPATDVPDTEYRHTLDEAEAILTGDDEDGHAAA